MCKLWWRLLLLDPALDALRKPHCGLLTLLTKDQHLPDHWTNIKSNAEDVAGRKFAQAMLLQWLTIMYILYFPSNNHQLTRNMSCLVLSCLVLSWPFLNSLFSILSTIYLIPWCIWWLTLALIKEEAKDLAVKLRTPSFHCNLTRLGWKGIKEMKETNQLNRDLLLFEH